MFRTQVKLQTVSDGLLIDSIPLVYETVQNIFKNCCAPIAPCYSIFIQDTVAWLCNGEGGQKLQQQ